MEQSNNAVSLVKLQDQLDTERRLVSFDSYDLSVRQILDMFENGDIIVPPEYQRQFIWDEKRQSQLIESVMLGIPIPSIFMATNADSTWEIVDGVQRLGSISHFYGGEKLLHKIDKEIPLEVSGVEKIDALNGMKFSDLPKSIKLMFATRPMRVTVLNDKSDLKVRFDLFERLNTGGISLTNQEIRNCVFRGKFNEDIKILSKENYFKKSIKLKPADEKNGTSEEFVLRFFAYLEEYKNFDHSVKNFLNNYMKEKSKNNIPSHLAEIFLKTFSVIHEAIPGGIVRNGRGVTPVNLYEGIAVGTALSLIKGIKISTVKIKQLIDDESLKKFTTAGTNNKKMVIGRIEYVADALAGK